MSVLSGSLAPVHAAVPLASLTNTLTGVLTTHGVGAVFAAMALDALLPVGGELTMLLAGALAAGALGGASPTLFGVHLGTGLIPYVVLSVVGTVGYLAGSLAGWFLGRRVGVDWLRRRGRLLHLGPDRLRSAERWFDRHGSTAVLLGRLTPLVRSFISVPAGAFGSPLVPYAIWCFAFAGAGWGLGARFDVVHGAFRYLDVAVAVGFVTFVALILL